jgi:hypothetical protein
MSTRKSREANRQDDVPPVLFLFRQHVFVFIRKDFRRAVPLDPERNVVIHIKHTLIYVMCVFRIKLCENMKNDSLNIFTTCTCCMSWLSNVRASLAA